MEEQLKSDQEPKPFPSKKATKPSAKRAKTPSSPKLILPFAVGCFHFGIKKAPPFKFTATEYIDEVELFLQAIPNVSNIVLDKDMVEDDTLEMTEKVHITQGTFPGFDFLNIQFEIYIPARLQERFHNLHQHDSDSVCDRFRVSIVDGYHCPVTFVEPLGIKPGEDPCQSIIAVREFLKEQSEKSESDFIEFQCLGPSPFHANFYIKPSEKSDEAPWLFWVEVLDTGSYDDIEIFYDANIFDTLEEAKTHIFEEISRELSLFYNYHQIYNSRAHEWAKVKDTFDGIIQIQKRKGVFGSLRRYFSSSKLRDAFISIAEFESNSLFLSNLMEDSYRSVYSSDRPSLVLKGYVDDTVEKKVEYPTRPLLELANLFESRREKMIESVVVLISAVLGGIVGALLTMLFT